MSSRIRLFPVLVILFVIVACGLISLQKLDGNISVMEDQVKKAEILLRDKQAEESRLIAEINEKDSNAYIIDHARAMGYLMPGEIRFVVTNPEVLYDVPEAVVVSEGIAP